MLLRQVTKNRFELAELSWFVKIKRFDQNLQNLQKKKYKNKVK